MQRIYQLSDGSSVHVTFAEWLTPKRRSIDRLGIVPDIEMIPDVNGRDVELGEAIRVLRQELQEGM
jgi:carboxyl-terminal processing protease